MTNRKGCVYTLYNECQDCYKCVRKCPVKSIRIQDGHAGVLSDKCIACGRCVASCPSHAKRVRNDLEAVRQLLTTGKKVYVSLAPSWRGAFANTSAQIVATFKKLGFTGVSETALGAEAVSIETARLLNEKEQGLMISSACPVIVRYIRLYRPQLAQYITPIASPALTHAQILKDTFGSDVAVVFVGPCIAKKTEADENPDLLAAALTFEEVKIWLKELDRETEQGNCTGEVFVPETAHEGRIYPLDGGMNETIRRIGVKENVQLLNVGSLEFFIQASNAFDNTRLVRPVFIEALACHGGCIHGPCITTQASDFYNISRVLRHTDYRDSIPLKPTAVVLKNYTPVSEMDKTYSMDEIREALHRIGKYLPEDELNCAGCGYQTCQDMAKALLAGNAEPSMCVSYMRKIAAKKADILIKSIPSAMVMLDKNLNMIEVNEAFIKMFTGPLAEVYLSDPQKLIGLPISTFFKAQKVFVSVLTGGQEIHKENHRYNNCLYDLNVFPIEPNISIGAVITDMTKASHSRELVAQKAKSVIDKNIETVQQIACLLGEHMVETETILNTIANEYTPEDED